MDVVALGKAEVDVSGVELQHGRQQAVGAGVDQAADVALGPADDTLDRRFDSRVAEVELARLQRRLLQPDVGLGLQLLADRVVQFFQGGGVRCDGFRQPLDLALRPVVSRRGPVEITIGFLHRDFELFRIDLEKKLPLLHLHAFQEVGLPLGVLLPVEQETLDTGANLDRL